MQINIASVTTLKNHGMFVQPSALKEKLIQKQRKSQKAEKLHPGTLSGSSLMSFTCTGSFPKTPIFVPVILRTASWAISEEA